MADLHMAGKKISGTHTTVTAPAKVVVEYAISLPFVKSVSLLEISKAKGATNADPRISVKILNAQVLQIKVTAKGHAQNLWISTRDQEKTVETLNKRFAFAH